MARGAAHLILADGQVVDLLPKTVSAVCEQLWEMAATERAAVSTVALLIGEADLMTPRHGAVELDKRQSRVFRRALARL